METISEQQITEHMARMVLAHAGVEIHPADIGTPPSQIAQSLGMIVTAAAADLPPVRAGF